MNKASLFSLLLLTLTQCLFSQTCLPGGITFSSQAEIDAFNSNYPACTIIEGDVIISGSNITQLNGLTNLQKIEGSLEVVNTNIIDFTGFSNLDTIVGGMRIETNDAMINFSGAPNLQFIGGNVLMILNTNLENFIGLELIETLSELSVHTNASILNFTGFNALSSVESMTISYCQSFENFNGLNSIVEIQSLYVTDLMSLTNLAGLESAQTIGALTLKNCETLNSLSGLLNIQNLNDLFITNCDALTSLTGLENLPIVSDMILTISFNDALIDILAIGDYSINVNSTLRLYYNPLLEICNSPAVCTFLDQGGAFAIFENAQGCSGFIDVIGACCETDVVWCPDPSSDCFPNGITINSQSEIDLFKTLYPDCTSIGGNVTIRYIEVNNLDSLHQVQKILGDLNFISTRINDLTGLTSLDTILGTFRIQNNSFMTNFSGIEALKFVGELIDISSNEMLENMVGFGELESIGGKLNINDNNNLSSLTGFENLPLVSDLKLDIQSNEVLSDISAIGNYTLDLNFLLFILNNPQLSVCNNPAICEFLDNDGPNLLVNNGVGCNEEMEILAACCQSDLMWCSDFEYIFTNPDGIWNDANNWDKGLIPDEMSVVIIPSPNHCEIQSGASAECLYINVEAGATFYCPDDCDFTTHGQ